MRMGFGVLAAMLALWVMHADPALAQLRVKDLVAMDSLGGGGAVLSGTGLVVGLPGTGDDVSRSPATAQMVGQMLGQMGMSQSEAMRRGGVYGGRDSAAVAVTARIPPNARAGTRLDVTVSSIGGARSLAGGTLVPTALEGGDRQVYAVAEGQVNASGYAVRGASQWVGRGNPTAGTVVGGAVLERDLPPYVVPQMEQVQLALRNPDFSMAKRIADAINRQVGGGVVTGPDRLASMRDAGTVMVRIPADYPDGWAGMMASLENVTLAPDSSASPRIVIDARAGTIVADEGITLAPVAISQGGLSIRVAEAPMVSQPPPFSQGGRTVVVPRSTVEITDGSGRVFSAGGGGTVTDLLRTMRQSGMGINDQVAVLQALRSAGALNADLISR